MRLRPGPLVETAALFAFGFVLAFVLYAILWQDVQVGFNFAFQATVLLFMPLFSLNAVVAFWLRDRESLAKFIGQAAGVVAVAVIGWLMLRFGGSPVSASDAHVIDLLVAIFAFSALFGALATQFWLIDNEGPVLRFGRSRTPGRTGQLETLNTSSSKPKKKKK